MLDTVRAFATLGEIRATLQAVYASFPEPLTF